MSLENNQPNEDEEKQRKNDEALKLGEDVFRRKFEQDARDLAREASVEMKEKIKGYLIHNPELKVFRVDRAYTASLDFLYGFDVFKDELGKLMGPKFKVTDNLTPGGWFPGYEAPMVIISLE